jgi:hypothetical protein
MSPKQIVLTTLAAVHLILVVCGAAGLFPQRQSSRPFRALTAYGALSGADSGYGFFAPGVAPQRRVRFVLTDVQGRSWAEYLVGASRTEASLRIGSVLGEASEPEWRAELAASWAAGLFSRHTEAKHIVALLEVEILPTLEEYRAGERPRWVIEYRAAFERAPAKASKEQ